MKGKFTLPIGRVQSNWEQDNPLMPDFIKNKPDIPAAYSWNIHSPEQVIDILDVPSGFLVDVDGSGGILQALASGDVKVTAINENGETTPADVGAFNVLTDSTYALITWDEVDGATGYRVYYDGNYQEVLTAEIDYLLFSGSAGTLPTENTAVIYQNSFQIDKDDTVQITGEGVDIETSVDLLDSTKKIVNIVKQQSSWSETDVNSPNYIPDKPTIPTPTNPIQVTGLTLSSASWSLVSGLYEYDLANANITANSIVEVIPDNADIDTVIEAVILPQTDSSSGSIKIYAKNEPTADIGVVINIIEKAV